MGIVRMGALNLTAIHGDTRSEAVQTVKYTQIHGDTRYWFFSIPTQLPQNARTACRTSPPTSLSVAHVQAGQQIQSPTSMVIEAYAEHPMYLTWIIACLQHPLPEKVNPGKAACSLNRSRNLSHHQSPETTGFHTTCAPQAFQPCAQPSTRQPRSGPGCTQLAVAVSTSSHQTKLTLTGTCSHVARTPMLPVYFPVARRSFPQPQMELG